MKLHVIDSLVIMWQITVLFPEDILVIVRNKDNGEIEEENWRAGLKMIKKKKLIKMFCACIQTIQFPQLDLSPSEQMADYKAFW